uniref:Ricin B lectin domain-containing protein n=1 Tax=Parascaris equorum TaxID=6256 RepID=A0A914RIN1_PAREQ
MHVVSDKCLEMSRDGSKLLVNTCDSSSAYQQWAFQEYNVEKAKQHVMLHYVTERRAGIKMLPLTASPHVPSLIEPTYVPTLSQANLCTALYMRHIFVEHKNAHSKVIDCELEEKEIVEGNFQKFIKNSDDYRDFYFARDSTLRNYGETDIN